MNYDIIGDVHGHHDKLEALLRLLGYRESRGAWRCTGRTAIFVGDLIDRGPGQLDTLNVARRMQEAGSARCIMGNHEFNAVAWTIPDPDHPGEFLRPHANPGHRNQHQAFLDAVEGTPRHEDSVAWFKSLPLWLDLRGLRVVHACWDDASIEALRPHLGADQALTDELFVQGSRKGHWAHAGIETLCKGPEVALPEGVVIHDKDGRRRTEVRIRWWAPDLSTYRKAAIGPADELSMIPDLPMPRPWQAPRYSGVPVVFGHYWFSGTPRVISERFACLDYSVAAGGPLVAYRWDGEPGLYSNKLVWV